MPSGTSIARSVASDVPDSVVKVRFYAFRLLFGHLRIIGLQHRMSAFTRMSAATLNLLLKETATADLTTRWDQGFQ